MVGVSHIIALCLIFRLFLFLFLLLELNGYLALPQLFCILWIIFLEEISFSDIFHLEMREGADLFVLGHAFIIGRVVKGFKTDIERCSFLGTKHSCLGTDNIDYIEILVILLRERYVNSRRQTPIYSF